eukprot:scaffold3538_cov86-Skeletonema_dohrnii-CCMP3373.AAC.3
MASSGHLRRCSDADTSKQRLSRDKDASILSWPHNNGDKVKGIDLSNFSCMDKGVVGSCPDLVKAMSMETTSLLKPTT